jgi:hypothetical protein
MSATTSAAQPVPSSRRRGRTFRLCRAGLTAGAAALLALELYAIVIKAAGVPMRAGLPGAHTATAVTLESFALAPRPGIEASSRA